MKKLICIVTFLSSIILCLAQSYVPEKNNSKVKVQPVVQVKAFAFPLSDVKLLPSPFSKAMQLDSAYLLSLSADCFRYIGIAVLAGQRIDALEKWGGPPDRVWTSARSRPWPRWMLPRSTN